MLNKTPRAFLDEIDPASVEALLVGRLNDPFAFLGAHETRDGRVVRTFQPGADAVEVVARGNHELLGQLAPVRDGLFSGPVSSDEPYYLRIHWPAVLQ
jgi:1,4-alpha-glucan branching enzyme